MEKKDKIFLDHPRFHKFVFNDQVASVFDDMVARSIPFYDEIHAIILDLIDQFYVKNRLIYDLGCSTGTTISLIDRHLKNQKKSAHFIGVDNSQSMLEKCHEKIKKNKIQTVTLTCDDILNLKFQPAQIIIMNYTLQFIDPKKRQLIMGRIYKALHPGGIFILSEKIKSKDQTVNHLLIDLYHDFKKRNGYSALEIARKRDALLNVLIPLEAKQQLQLLQKSGFKKSEEIFRWYNFACFIGIK
ncbi:MAG: carboxy-S-adenosyl-L-methionine synthase CmoA [Bdellovibrionales bacterium RIFOXYB1_FULL_37_110]|nr:MAG: carboxy-S-adenosyl-L-methionine synthase CmoA [Bdellovibrionales bacterium RIFOXYA1_FULL_38_20]OFZ52002.1 MAG: carboxy-S-adenosyl-L-methionine synthase CmoA [Bdellovibrionales bacterium RIFOXYC1_FULL_37_79]OFZ60580.1 MAG: carboxy-S-adenosyl-L-methionine synthase CmoA [Bdellovibrionales bacterium RIFOXYB1_FULL_37_110]OFZ61771.1 MAG: carboxy-S-adenosyl-L-methionine synthase CmoA [Bdellovibrionales bacterium RIFOXYD1_FULL_36_51]